MNPHRMFTDTEGAYWHRRYDRLRARWRRRAWHYVAGPVALVVAAIGSSAVVGGIGGVIAKSDRAANYQRGLIDGRRSIIRCGIGVTCTASENGVVTIDAIEPPRVAFTDPDRGKPGEVRSVAWDERTRQWMQRPGFSTVTPGPITSSGTILSDAGSTSTTGSLTLGSTATRTHAP